jgi:hypothetical protein
VKAENYSPQEGFLKGSSKVLKIEDATPKG